MQVKERCAGDAGRLRAAARRAVTIEQRDRYLVAVQSLAGASTLEIQQNLRRSRGFVQRWAYAYRDRGIEAVRAKPLPGRVPRLSPDQQAELLARVAPDTKPRAARVRYMLAQEYGIIYSLSGVYALMRRIKGSRDANEM